jgi:hypothetical protein
MKKALAGLGYVTLTAGGDFHPALRTSAARNGRPDTNMTKGRALSKRLPHRNLHVPMPMEQGSGPFPAGASPNLQPADIRARRLVGVQLKKAGAWKPRASRRNACVDFRRVTRGAVWRRVKKELTIVAARGSDSGLFSN